MYGHWLSQLELVCLPVCCSRWASNFSVGRVKFDRYPSDWRVAKKVNFGPCSQYLIIQQSCCNLYQNILIWSIFDPFSTYNLNMGIILQKRAPMTPSPSFAHPLSCMSPTSSIDNSFGIDGPFWCFYVPWVIISLGEFSHRSLLVDTSPIFASANSIGLSQGVWVNVSITRVEYTS